MQCKGTTSFKTTSFLREQPDIDRLRYIDLINLDLRSGERS